MKRFWSPLINVHGGFGRNVKKRIRQSSVKRGKFILRGLSIYLTGSMRKREETRKLEANREMERRKEGRSTGKPGIPFTCLRWATRREVHEPSSLLSKC